MSAPVHLPGDRPRSGMPGWPTLPARFVAGAVLLVVLAGLAGWIGRSATTPTRSAPSAPPRSVSLGAVTLAAPATWTTARRPVAGLEDLGRQTAAFAPVPGLSARAVVTLAPFDDHTLLPAPLRAFAGDSAPRRATLAGLPAWAYRPRQLGKGRTAQVTVAATTAGSLAVVCLAPEAIWSGAARCAEGLTAASLTGATPLVPSATLAFRRHLTPVLSHLGTRRAELRGRLHAAETRRGQARFAERLARANARAATALAPRAASAETRQVVHVLRGARSAYGRLAVAARRGWPARYRYARAGVLQHARALARAVAAVR